MTTIEQDVNFKTLRELIEHRAALTPDGVFLASPETGRRLTFHDLAIQTAQVAQRLAGLGLRPGDKVAFLMDNGLFTAQIFLGAMAGGYVAVPLNTRAGVASLAYTVEHSDASVVFVEAQYQDLYRQVSEVVNRTVTMVIADIDGLATDENLDVSKGEAWLPVPAPEDVALLMYTSGSTGKPKAAVHTHRTVLAHGANSVAAHQLTAADCSLLVLPLYHINAECVTLIPTLVSGGTVVIPRHFSVSRFWDWLEEYHCTWSAVVPTIISQLLDWKDPRADQRQAMFRRIRFMRSSSAPLSPALHREFLAKFDVWLIQAMGSSECGNIFSNPQRPAENKIGSPGLSWGFEVRIVNPEGEMLGRGEPGEVLLRGPALMRGYYKDAEGTATVLDEDGWFHTGDLAYRDGDGYLFVVGRSKELIIKGVVNISTKQIDEVLESHAGVLEAAAVGVADRHVGEDVVAYVVMRAGQRVEERELLKYCEERLGPFKTPTRIFFTTDLPRGPSGKVQRLKLQERAQQDVNRAGSDAGIGAVVAGAKPTPIEQTIAGIWRELLKQPHIGLESNFFSLGGHSLLAIQSLSKLRERLPVTLSLSDFFEHATVAQQAALIRKRLRPEGEPGFEATVDWEQEVLKQIGGAEPEAIPVRDRSQPCPLSPAQERLWFLEQLNSGVPVYHESEAVRLEGPLNIEALEQALHLIVARHEILRTIIKAVGDNPAAVTLECWQLKLGRISLAGLNPQQRQVELDRLLIEEPRKPHRLELEPGLRATLIELGPEDHVLILMMHHLICDWASEGVIWRELSQVYRALRKGQAPELPPLAIQHGDYAAWQQELMAAGSFGADLDYWKAKLKGVPALLELPTDHPRPAVNTYRGARKRYVVGTALVKLLRHCGREQNISLFTLFTAALNVLLYRYSGMEDISLGIPLADRDRPELQHMIGFLLHTHSLRTRLAKDMSFRELLAGVQKGVLDLYAHRAPPFDQVVSVVQPERNLSYSPLFQVMINWRDRDQQLSFIGMEGLRVSSLLAETRTSKFDLTFMLTDDADEIWLEIEYATDLFDEDRIDRMAGHYQTLLEGIVAHPGQTLGKLPLLTDFERQQLLDRFNRTQAVYPADRCLHEIIEEQVNRTPDAVAVVFENERLTYRQLNDRANQLALHLQNLKVKPDSFVAICVERTPDVVIGTMGVLKSGAAYVPLDPKYPSARLALYLKDCEAPVILTQRKLLPSLPPHAARVICLDDALPDQPVGKPAIMAGASNLAYMIYTSGSTGVPKGVAIEHRSAVNFIKWGREVFTDAEMAGVLASTSICFDLSIFEIFSTLSRGGKIIIAENVLELPHLPARNLVTLVNTVPSAIATLMHSGGLPPQVKTVNLAGEPLPTSLVDQIYALKTVEKVYDLYGPTETTTYSTFTLRKPANKPMVGRPIANTQIYILDEMSQPVPIGIAGEIYIGGIGLARGYHNRPQLTREKFVANPFKNDSGERLYRTGDRGRFLPGGDIEYLGRIDNQVKIRGFRIELGEIETLLTEHPSVRDAAVLACEDAPGEKLLASYVIAENGKPPSASELREYLQTKLPAYMVPAVFVNLERFPLTPNGKVDRKAFPKPQIEPSATDYRAPKTPTEVALAKIWCDILGLSRVGTRESFFEIGGHSLLAMRLASRIKRDLNFDLPVRMIFQYPRIESLASEIAEVPAIGRKSELIHVQAGGSGPDLVFLVDEGSLGLFKLAYLLDKNWPMYVSVSPLPESALRASAENRLQDLPSIRDLARAHVALIRSRQSRRPIILVGHCFGGQLAFEIAHQLKAAGEQIEALLMLDTWMVRPGFWWNKKTWMRAHFKRFLQQGPAYFWRKSRRRINLEKDGLASQLKLMADGNYSLHVPWSIILRIYRHARPAQGWPVEKLNCRGLLFISRDDWISNAYRRIDNTLGTRQWFTQEVEVVDVPGDHVTALDEMHLPELARCFNEVLRKFYGMNAPGQDVPLALCTAVSSQMADVEG